MMRTIRIYQPGHFNLGQTLTLSEAAAQHVGVVLRLTIGAKITLFGGDNFEYQAFIISIHKKKIDVCIKTVHQANRESFRAIHLAQSIAKGDKMEWIIQKAVELGVTRITPLVTERTNVRLSHERLEKKRHQWQAICISACEQSGRNHIPVIDNHCSLQHFLEMTSAAHKWMLSPQAEHTWPQQIDNEKELVLVVGPEGGFTEQELNFAADHDVQGMRLGPRVLRTETAAITGISILQKLYGDL